MTQDKLKSLVHYEPTTGVFIWLVNRRNTRCKGKIAGNNYCKGYRHIKIDQKDYLSHRLAFLYMTGSIPEFIDHKDHIRSNNIWSNLRAATVLINARNQSLNKNNKSGFNGVSYHKGKKYAKSPWIAYIKLNGIRKHLGSFVTKDEAIAAREAANIEHGFHENHGK